MYSESLAVGWTDRTSHSGSCMLHLARNMAKRFSGEHVEVARGPEMPRLALFQTWDNDALSSCLCSSIVGGLIVFALSGGRLPGSGITDTGHCREVSHGKAHDKYCIRQVDQRIFV